MSSWGTLIRYGVESMEEYSWLLIFPGLTFTITLFALNFFGDGLRDVIQRYHQIKLIEESILKFDLASKAYSQYHSALQYQLFSY